MEYEYRCGAISGNCVIATEADIGFKRMRANIRDVVANGFVHNYIMINGEKIFNGESFLKARNEIRMKNTQKSEWTDHDIWCGFNKYPDGNIKPFKEIMDRDTYEKELKQYIENETDRIMAELNKYNTE